VFLVCLLVFLTTPPDWVFTPIDPVFSARRRRGPPGPGCGNGRNPLPTRERRARVHVAGSTALLESRLNTNSSSNPH